jgi:6-phosphogluconolactonase (cycloisomerase 2 family)
VGWRWPPPARPATIPVHNIALNRSGTLLFGANREADSLTAFKVGKGGSDVLTKFGRGPFGEEPFCVAVAGQRAFVVNADSDRGGTPTQ